MLRSLTGYTMLNQSLVTLPKITVLVPCFNSERFLTFCLTSLQNQTFQNIQFICINDGSQDSTQIILEKFQLTDKRFVVITKNNSGYGDSLNLGLSLANGEYIGIVEPDDFVEPNMFKVLYEMAIEHDLDIARCSYYYHSKNGDVEQHWPEVPKNKVIDPKNYISVFKQGPSVWANLYRSSWLKKHSINFLTTPGASFQDTSFAFKTYFCAQKFMMTDLCLLHYRIDNECSSVHNKNKIFSVMDEWNEIFKFFSLSPVGNVFDRNKLGELQHRTYLWNLGRLDWDGKRKFLMKWHQEAKSRKVLNQTQLLRLSLSHLIIEAIVLYCPFILMFYNKNSTIVKWLRKFFY